MFQVSLEATLEGHTTDIGIVRFSPDGSFFASTDGTTLRFWSRNEQGQWYQQRCLAFPVRFFAFSPVDRQMVVLTVNYCIEVWTYEGVKQATLLPTEMQGGTGETLPFLQMDAI